MAKIILNEQQVDELVKKNRYKIDEKSRFISRCIDGRYPDVDDLPPLALPGADAGQLSLILAGANNAGLDVVREKVYESLDEVVGGEKNLRMHTDNHSEGLMAGCGHMKQTTLDPEAFNVTPEDVDFINDKMAKAKKKGAQEVVLEGDHLEGAVLMVKGNWSVKTRYEFETEEGQTPAQVFVFHQTLVNERHKSLAKKLLEKKTFNIVREDDEEYLYTILSESSEAHLFEIAKRLAKGLPIYEITFKENGDFDFKKLDEV